MEDGRFMQSLHHDTCFLLCGYQSFLFADKTCLGGLLIKKKIQILGDEFSQTPGYYKSRHWNQVAREKKNPLDATKGK